MAQSEAQRRRALPETPLRLARAVAALHRAGDSIRDARDALIGTRSAAAASAVVISQMFDLDRAVRDRARVVAKELHAAMAATPERLVVLDAAQAAPQSSDVPIAWRADLHLAHYVLGRPVAGTATVEDSSHA